MDYAGESETRLRCLTSLSENPLFSEGQDKEVLVPIREELVQLTEELIAQQQGEWEQIAEILQASPGRVEHWETMPDELVALDKVARPFFARMGILYSLLDRVEAALHPKQGTVSRLKDLRNAWKRDVRVVGPYMYSLFRLLSEVGHVYLNGIDLGKNPYAGSANTMSLMYGAHAAREKQQELSGLHIFDNGDFSAKARERLVTPAEEDLNAATWADLWLRLYLHDTLKVWERLKDTTDILVAQIIERAERGECTVILDMPSGDGALFRAVVKELIDQEQQSIIKRGLVSGVGVDVSQRSIVHGKEQIRKLETELGMNLGRNFKFIEGDITSPLCLAKIWRQGRRLARRNGRRAPRIGRKAIGVFDNLVSLGFWDYEGIQFTGEQAGKLLTMHGLLLRKGGTHLSYAFSAEDVAAEITTVLETAATVSQEGDNNMVGCLDEAITRLLQSDPYALEHHLAIGARVLLAGWLVNAATAQRYKEWFESARLEVGPLLLEPLPQQNIDIVPTVTGLRRCVAQAT